MQTMILQTPTASSGQPLTKRLVLQEPQGLRSARASAPQVPDCPDCHCAAALWMQCGSLGSASSWVRRMPIDCESGSVRRMRKDGGSGSGSCLCLSSPDSISAESHPKFAFRTFVKLFVANPPHREKRCRLARVRWGILFGLAPL